MKTPEVGLITFLSRNRRRLGDEKCAAHELAPKELFLSVFGPCLTPSKRTNKLTVTIQRAVSWLASEKMYSQQVRLWRLDKTNPVDFGAIGISEGPTCKAVAEAIGYPCREIDPTLTCEDEGEYFILTSSDHGFHCAAHRLVGGEVERLAGPIGQRFISQFRRKAKSN